MTTTSWIPATGGNFADSADWTSGTLPGSSDYTRITEAGVFTVTSSASESVLNLHMTGKSTLAIQTGTFSVDAVGTSYAPFSIAAKNAITVADGAKLELSLGTLDVAGQIDVASGGEMELGFSGPNSSGVILQSAGTINLGAGSLLQIDQGVTLYNYDTVITNGTIDTTAGAAPGTLANLGLISLGEGADLALTVFNYNTILAANGTTISGSFDNEPLSMGEAVLGAGANAIVNLNGAIVNSGVLEGDTGSSFQIEGAGATLEGYTQSIVNRGLVNITDATALALIGTIVNYGSLALDSTGDITTLRLESQVDLGGKDTAASRKIELTGNGTLVLGDNAQNVIYATHSTDIFASDGNVISGAGQIGDGKAMTFDNDGLLVATGSNALVINVATGKVLDQPDGVLEAAGTGGLSLTGGTFDIEGAVKANGGNVTFGSAAHLTNFVAGVLTGGTWLINDLGSGAALTLFGQAISPSYSRWA